MPAEMITGIVILKLLFPCLKPPSHGQCLNVNAPVAVGAICFRAALIVSTIKLILTAPVATYSLR
jgi:hypothetical protein